MAVLAAPGIDWGGDEPQSQGALVPFAGIAPGGQATYTFPVLAAPAANQLLPPIPEAEGMYVWQATITDEDGNIVPSAGCEVRDAETNALVSLFEDAEGEDPLTNPFTTGEDGLARFYTNAGLYRIRAFFGGNQQIWQDVLLGIRMQDLPDLTDLVEDIAGPLIEAAIDAIDFPEIPEIPEGQILFGSGRVNADGTPLSLPFGWDSELVGVSYTVTHNGDLDPDLYTVTGTAVSAAGHANFQVTSYGANSFTCRVFNDENGNITSVPFAFDVSLINPDSV